MLRQNLLDILCGTLGARPTSGAVERSLRIGSLSLAMIAMVARPSRTPMACLRDTRLLFVVARHLQDG